MSLSRSNDPSEKPAARASARASSYVDYEIEPVGAGVKLTYRARWKPIGLFLWLLAPLFRIMGREHAQQALGRLKAMAEAASTA